MGSAQIRHGTRSGRGEIQERVSSSEFRGCDFDLPALALLRCRLLRYARTRLSAAGANSDGRTAPQNRRDLSTEPWIRIQYLLSAPRVSRLLCRRDPSGAPGVLARPPSR